MLLQYYSLFRFVIELLPATLLYTSAIPRRRHFPARLLCGILLCLFVSRLWNGTLAANPLLSMVRYLALFSCVGLTVRLSFDLPPIGAMFYAVSGYATQHFTLKLFYFIKPFLSDLPPGLTYAVYVLCLGLCYGSFFLLFARRMHGNRNIWHEQKETLLLCGAVITCTIVFSIISNTGKSTVSFGINVVLTGFAMLCCVLILYLQYVFFQKGMLQAEMKWMEHQWEQEKRQYRFSKDCMDLIAVKCHDMKHLLNSAGSRLTEEELTELRDLIDLYDADMHTGCEVLDVLLSEKAAACRRRSITLTCMADGAVLGRIRQSDLYSLLGNALDNAIEAVSKLEDTEKRVISLTVEQRMNTAVIHIENYYTGQLTMADGLPVTTKDDRRYHGFGMKSMRMMAEKYGGTVSCRTEGDLFSMDILLPEQR